MLNILKIIKKYITPLHILIVFLSFMLFSVLLLFFFLYKDVDLEGVDSYYVLPGLSARNIAYDLAERKIIKYPWLFNLYAKLKGMDTKIQAGNYKFPKKKMDLVEIVDFFTKGARPDEIEFTIPEGYTVSQISDFLFKKGIVKKEEFLTALNDKSADIKKFGIDTKDLEGFLFPDTYRIYKDSDPDIIISKMLNNFERKVYIKLKDDIKQSKRSFYDILKMASILEKEVKTEEDMRMVSDILWRRLDSNMLLQVDSTLNYIIGGNSPSLTYEQLKIDSPYNTYKYKGLPPTPICNPGLKAIIAAIYPKKNDYWYYLSKPNGETVFSSDFNEHIKNKSQHLKQ